MSKRAFRRQVEPESKEASYPTLDAVQSDRRSFLRRLGLGILGAGTIGGLMACDGRAVGDNEHITMGGVPDAAPPPEPDAWRLGGARPEPDAGPPPTPPPDMGIAPQADLEPHAWDMGGVMTDISPPTPPADASVPKADSWEVGGGPDQPPDAGTRD